MKNNGEIMKLLRESHGISQKEIIKKLNINQSTYSNYENGRGNPPKEVIKQLCEILGESLNDFQVASEGYSDCKFMDNDFEEIRHLIASINDKRTRRKLIFEFDDLMEDFKERIETEIEHGEK